MYQLKKINLLSVVVYSFILIFILGFLIMLPFGFINMLFSSFTPGGFFPRHYFYPFRFIFLFLFPFIYAIIGTIINFILALIYNLISTGLGGIKINLEKIGSVNEISEL